MSDNDVGQEPVVLSTICSVEGEDGEPLDAAVTVYPSSFVLHSRGGSKGSKNETNLDYSQALRLILRRLSDSETPIQAVWVDSAPVQAMPIADRTILTKDEASASAASIFTLLSRRMQAIGRAPTSKSSHGNSNKRIRFNFSENVTDATLIQTLRLSVKKVDSRAEALLLTSDLQKVTPVHLWNARNLLDSGFADHGFPDSEVYDVLLEDGTRLPPKALFGVAASEALGFKVLPMHFRGGLGTPAFHIMTEAGYVIVPKGENQPGPQHAPLDKEWVDGTPQFRKHLSKERAPGLSAAKKAAFRSEYGKLFCERCKADPVATYKSVDGEACIEVHHHATHVADMAPGHKTRLADLMCLCANCHRVEHRLLRMAHKGAKTLGDPQQPSTT